MKLLSIVIANYNYGHFLEQAICSVVSQKDFEKCELIIVDGGSTDNSVSIIKKYSEQISWWVSEKDRGQSDAFNKGFSNAKGKYLTWVNADDVLASGCLQKIVRQLEAHPDCEWFTGNMYRFLESNKKIMEIDWGPNWYPRILQRKNSPVVAFGAATVFSKKIFEQVGRMDESFRLTMDTDLWRRFMVAGIKQRRIRCFCWGFRMHEESKTAEFEGHERKDRSKMSPRIYSEWKRSVDKCGYHASRCMFVVMRIWRIIDMSFLTRAFLQWRYMGRLYSCIGD